MVKFCSSLVLVIACVACGSRFSAHEGGGAAGFGNEENGGQSSAEGGSDTGTAGDTSGGGSSSGGSANTGGVGTSGSGNAKGGAGGSPTEDPCVRLKQQYQTALEKARLCDLGSMDQCSPSSTVEPLGCGCPVLVNAKSESVTSAKKARQAYLNAKCDEGMICAAIACAQPVSASCAPGTVAANTFVCTASTSVGN